ncbi:hypothetical protein ACIGHB_04805 [Streptomyces sp. NPDC085460]|uniref:hypothetical protein n=1 Tax=Streptomyces sp. NPDC085460 TaxID=3365723 RepID=UPI0037D60D22
MSHDDSTPATPATLSLVERDGVTVIEASGGTLLPERLIVVDASGNTVAVYEGSTPTHSRGLLDKVFGNRFDYTLDEGVR